uniref:Dispatched RND transporter family member 3 n=1 Tax=Salmo trutta TaxID=8032 RepID=A0A674F741_SALTR
MDLEDELLLFQSSWDAEKEEEEEEEGGESDTQINGRTSTIGGNGVWGAVGWVYTQPWVSGVVLGVGVFLLCALSAYMFLYCPPLDIDLSYSAFEVHSHCSAERFDALTIAIKTQLGSWDRRRRDVDPYDSTALQELLLNMYGTERRCPESARDGETRGGKSESRETIEGESDRDSERSQTRMRRFAPNYLYLQSQAMWRMELVFVAQGGGDNNIFTPERLRTIHHIERLLMQHPQFQQFCWKPLEVLRDLPLGPSYCSPPSSLLSYLFPSERGGRIYYDGMGPNLADIHGALSLAITHPQFYWHVDESLAPDRLSSLLHIEIQFGAPLPSYCSLQDRPEEQRSRFRNFVVQYADILAQQSTSHVKVLYGGTELFDNEVRQSFYRDMLLALISGGCITLLVYFLTSFSSKFPCTLPPALDITSLVFGVRYLGILNGVAALCCCLLRPDTHAPLRFHPDTNLQTLLGLRNNLSAQGISCHMCSGLFMEKPPLLHSPTHTTPSVAWFHAQQHTKRPLLTVYVSKLGVGTSITLYRFSLNTRMPSPWKSLSPRNGEVPSFQAYIEPHSNFSTHMTVCVSHPSPRWMITSQSYDPRHGWRSEFSFYVASAEQQHSRRLYFAQHKLSPHPSRVCAEPPGCVISYGPDGPTRGYFYTLLPTDSTSTKRSRTSGFNPCSGGSCGQQAVRPLVDTGAMVFVVFGILGVNRSQRTDNHVIGDMGSVILDPNFDIFQEIGHLCQICKVISANKQLVKPGRAQCLPSGNKLSSILPLLHPDCHSLPEPKLLPGQLSHGAVGTHGGRVRWLSMAFESTTYKGKSSFQTRSDFLQWETFLQEQLSALRRGFQTCEHWNPEDSVESALCSLLLSLAICVAAVSVFTTHTLLLLPILLTIMGVICLVVAIMNWLGWELGAMEAISLSILVGSSVEGYLLAGETLPSTPEHTMDLSAKRQRQTLDAVNHVGVAIVSSAVPTVISTILLFFCVIVPFAKFGQIVAINTVVSILFTLTVTAAMLATMGPANFHRPPGAVLKASLAVLGTTAFGVALCWATRTSPWHTVVTM